MNAIERACEIVGGQSQLAEVIGVSPSFVSHWINNVRPIPAEKCVAIEMATGVNRCDLYSGDPSKLWPEIFAAQKVGAGETAKQEAA